MNKETTHKVKLENGKIVNVKATTIGPMSTMLSHLHIDNEMWFVKVTTLDVPDGAPNGMIQIYQDDTFGKLTYYPQNDADLIINAVMIK